MQCVTCGKEFQGARSTAKYCSGACRAKAMRVSARPELAHALAHAQSEDDIHAVIRQSQGQPLDPDTQAIWDRWDKQRRGVDRSTNLALPGDPDYEGVCAKVEGVWACG